MIHWGDVSNENVKRLLIAFSEKTLFKQWDQWKKFQDTPRIQPNEKSRNEALPCGSKKKKKDALIY